RNKAFSMRWFGFGFNAFGQICVHEKSVKVAGRDVANEVKVNSPTELSGRSGCCSQISQIKACWSRRASLHLIGESKTTSQSNCASRGQTLLLFDTNKRRLQYHTLNSCIILLSLIGDRPLLNLPLVPGGYIATKPPLYRPLAPDLKAKSLALGAEHAILLCATGAVYTWGLGSHGQLGHGGLTSEEEPKAVEALWGMPMSCVATGGWHSVCISDGGDLYVWGWNESGQLGLPSRGLRKAAQQQKPQEGEKQEEVFISIQAFPALLDVTPSCEISTVSCGSRHTAAVTTTGDLYTWGWGEYGQLGHHTLISSDEPQRVEYFRKQQMRVVDVVCGTWNTFAAVVKEEVACS
uniref:RCC1 domain containing 1 n=1 Tax=Seriola dumerili TaxID=41447 RepID=A0A3B4UZE7_SERDU